MLYDTVRAFKKLAAERGYVVEQPGRKYRARLKKQALVRGLNPKSLYLLLVSGHASIDDLFEQRNRVGSQLCRLAEQAADGHCGYAIQIYYETATAAVTERIFAAQGAEPYMDFNIPNIPVVLFWEKARMAYSAIPLAPNLSAALP